MIHVRKWQRKGLHFQPKTEVIPNVKSKKDIKVDGKYKTVPLKPEHINVNIKFANGTDKDGETKKLTLFKCPIHNPHINNNAFINIVFHIKY